MEKCRHCLLGNPSFTIITDHNPLVGLFRKDIPAIDNKRLQRYMERLQAYNFELKWAEGKGHLIADAFSRQPTSKPTDHNKLNYVSTIPMAAKPILMLVVNTNEDYKAIITALKVKKNIHNLLPEHQAKPKHQDRTSYQLQFATNL